jgi:hypothetical protein
MREGGYAAMLFDLLARNLGDWHPRDVIHTEALTGQQAESLSPLDAWWYELLQTGVVAGADSLIPGEVISNEYDEQIEEPDGYGGTRKRTVKREGFFDQAHAMSPKLKRVTDAALGRYLTDNGCVRITIRRAGRQKRGWRLPLLGECRQRWNERFPEMQWDDPSLANWTADKG